MNGKKTSTVTNSTATTSTSISALSFFKDRLTKNEKRINQQFQSKSSDLFKGLRIYFDGYTDQVSLIHLKKLVILHGGTHSHWFSPTSCTHIIGTCMSLTKYEQVIKRNLPKSSRIKKIHYVHPDWILDSCKFEKLQPEVNYYLFDKLASLNKSNSNNNSNSDGNDTQTLNPTTISNNNNDNDIRNYFKSNSSNNETILKKRTGGDYSDILNIDEYSFIKLTKKSKPLDEQELQDSLVDPKLTILDYTSNVNSTSLFKNSYLLQKTNDQNIIIHDDNQKNKLTLPRGQCKEL
ncbi:hypothetical protein CYY_009730 [Polysphondylium violaceum]|uniref:BRCT domain-containing protein n=1 Tax=Polysphondylium violaceum TaxID=133409 RepID=A0A8J4PT66_9MYCE|nr:hypothetical protein CYY_009730 [Polysphondylium violaceum]